MGDTMLCKLSTLGHVDGDAVTIKTSTDTIYHVDIDCTIYVQDGVSATFMDTTKEKIITVVGDINSNIDYTIFHSENSKRVFDIKGELNINEISLNETNEALNISLLNENANCKVKCLSIAAAANTKYIQRIDHKYGSTSSNISNVGIAMNKSNVVFDTTGFVGKGMSKSKCSQLSRGIVMDDDSQITAKPILLIDEFDCFANHGASIGKMSDEDLFYLMSRGLSKKEAFLLILQGIIRPFIDSIPVDDWKENIEEDIENLIEK